MRRSLVLAMALTLAALVSVPVLGAPPLQDNFRAHLSGKSEVPPAATNAQGQVIFQLRDGELSFKLIAANINNILQAHIHCGSAGVNGPVVAFLYPPGPPPMLIPGRFAGVLSTGTLTNADVRPAPDSDLCPGGVGDFDDLIAKMRAGETYTNVHTTAFPGGEIRGQNR